MSEDAQARAKKAQRTRKANKEKQDQLAFEHASVKSELKAIKKFIRDGWSPPQRKVS